MGWLKVAEQLINPYGEDDDDFELNWCIDRNLLVSFTIVDEMYNKHPKLTPDAFWDKREPMLPYTKSSINTKLTVHPHLGSTIDLNVEPEDFLPMETIMEEEHEMDFNYSSPPTTSMVDAFGNQAPNWFQNQHPSVQIQMDNPQDSQQHLLEQHHKFPAKRDNKGNVSKNHSELIESLKADSNQSSRCTSRNGMRSFLPDFMQDSKLLSKLIGTRSNNSHNSNALSGNVPQYQNYSNLTKYYNQQHQTNPNTFLLKTPTKKQRGQTTGDITLSNQQQQNDIQPKTRPVVQTSNQNQNQTLNIPYSMNTASNASIGNLNTMHNLNNFNTSLSATTMNNSQHLAGSNQNLIGDTSNISNKNKLNHHQSNRRIEQQHDDLTSATDDQKYEQQSSDRNHRNLRLNRSSNLNHPVTQSKYRNLPTAPVLPTFSSSSQQAKNRTSPFMNRLRNSLNFSSHHYRNLNKLGPRNKRNSFSSAISLKSKCDNPTSDQLVSPNGFHFPQAYIAPKNPNQYLPLHLRQESASALTLDQENELNNNLNNAENLNKLDNNDANEIKVSPASRASHRNLNLNAQQELHDLNEEENLIVMDDLKNKNKGEDKIDNENKESRDGESDKNEELTSKLRSENSNSNYTIATAAAILKASNENDLVKLKSSSKPNINNQDSQPLTSTGTLTGGTLTENHSKSSSTRSSSGELNQENENQSLLNKNEEAETSSSSNETNQQLIQNQILSEQQQQQKQNEQDEIENQTRYSPNEDIHEERYQESPTSSNDSLSPYESNQNTVSSYTQLLEKDKNAEY